MGLWFRNTKTKRVYEVLSRDKEKGTVKLKGSFGEFTEDFDPAKFKSLGYELVQADTKEAALDAKAA